MADGVGKHSRGERWELLQSMTGAWFIYPAGGAAGLPPIEPKVRLPKKGATAEMFARARLMAKSPELAEALRASQEALKGFVALANFDADTVPKTSEEFDAMVAAGELAIERAEKLLDL